MQNLSFAAAEPGNTATSPTAIQRAEKEIGGSPRRLYHLAVPPAAFTSVVGMLGAAGLASGRRVIIEKPFGTDLESARKLNQAVHAVFDESQVFRIDHFLGKESVDNILAFRFANGLFEPVWNRDHIQYVQIDVPETLSIEGRAAFYDATGAYRDMVVTHLFQVMAFLAMEPPVSLREKPMRDEKEKVFERSSRSTPGMWSAASTGGTPPSRGSGPSRRPRPWSRCGSRWRTGAGMACRSSCVRVRPWPPRARSSRSASTSRRPRMFRVHRRTSRPAG